MTFKIATWNVNSLKVRLPQVIDWLKKESPDVLAVQETKLIDDKFPETEIKDAGYQVIYAGQKTYNGVALISKKSFKEVVTDLPRFKDPQRRILGGTLNKTRILNVYVPNGFEVGSEKYVYKLDWLKHFYSYIKQQLKAYNRLIVLGDFNIAPEDRDVYNPKAWEGQVLVSKPERDALKKLISLGLHDTFRLFNQSEDGYSFWDYRFGAFKRNYGLRIDLILISAPLVKKCKKCAVDKTPRAFKRPSDHAPVIGIFEL